MKIALLGATSHIAKSLIPQFTAKPTIQLVLFSRTPEKSKAFLNCLATPPQAVCLPLEDFPKYTYDAVINCIGLGDPNKISQASESFFMLNETYDNLVLNYLLKHSETRYIFFSSGAVYGTAFEEPVSEQSSTSFTVNNLTPSDFYRLSKLNSEAKHRSLGHLSIIDLRIFSYFSRYIDLNAAFLLSQLVSCASHQKPFITTHSNIWRDFIHPTDLFSFILKLLNHKAFLNTAFDISSKAPVSKHELIAFFETRYKLKTEYTDALSTHHATGAKSVYYSVNKMAESFGFSPQFTSLETIESETTFLIKQ